MNRTAYIFIFLVSVFISAISQIVLKCAANREYRSKFAEYMNPRVIAAYSMFFVSSLMTVFAYKGVPLTLGPILEATGYIYVAILSAIFLKEKATRKKIIGNALIVFGVIVAALF